MSRVFVERFARDDLYDTVRRAFEWIDWQRLVPAGGRVFLKPNFTYPFYEPGVTTSPEVIEAIVQVLSDRTNRVLIGESDGGSCAWTADQAFEGHGLAALRDRYAVELVNLSRLPRENATAEVSGRTVEVVLPSLLLHEVDTFITVPVPKLHAMTGVSLGFKNQWGCLPDIKRLRYHYTFNSSVIAINKIVRPKISLFDGTYFLDRSGPMTGDAIRMNLIISSDDIGAGSLACCDIMQVNAMRVPHLALARAEGMLPASLETINLNRPTAEFRRAPFRLRRTWLNWLSLGTFRSRLATRLFYDSPLAKPAHDLLYLVRGAPKDIAPQW